MEGGDERRGEVRRRHGGGREVEVKGQQLGWRCRVNKARTVSVGSDGFHTNTPILFNEGPATPLCTAASLFVLEIETSSPLIKPTHC